MVSGVAPPIIAASIWFVSGCVSVPCLEIRHSWKRFFILFGTFRNIEKWLRNIWKCLLNIKK